MRPYNSNPPIKVCRATPLRYIKGFGDSLRLISVPLDLRQLPCSYRVRSLSSEKNQ
ncbi:hypothetical protein [Coleofasciculus sp. E1-EBD-02]|uniref:hypothetical protein n=1 Tax=Coleofasciculus sp. E1-EBD-02 TaxID=3068481 RepID=UPI0032F21C20